MPLGGLLPYGDEPTAAVTPQPQGFGQQLLAQLPNLLNAFAAGQAIRQRNPVALSGILENAMQGIESRRRGRLAEEAQRLREEREFRLAEQAGNRESRLIDAQRMRAEADKADAARQGRVDLSTLTNQISDDSAKVFRPGFEGAPLEEFITQQTNRVQGMEGADPAALRALLMSMATGLSRPEPPVPYLERQPGTPPPATVQKGTIIRNAPRPPAAKEPPVPVQVTDEQGNIYLMDPRSGKRITSDPVGKRPKPQGQPNDALDRIIAEAQAGGKPAGSLSVTAPNGKTYTFKSQADADAFKKAAGIR